jgi:hypothetical protein
MFNNLPIEIEREIIEMSKQMLFSSVVKELKDTKRYMYRVTKFYTISRIIPTWHLPNNKMLKITNRQIYVFDYDNDLVE